MVTLSSNKFKRCFLSNFSWRCVSCCFWYLFFSRNVDPLFGSGTGKHLDFARFSLVRHVFLHWFGTKCWQLGYVAGRFRCTLQYMSSPARAQQRISTAIMCDRMRNCFVVKVVSFSFFMCVSWPHVLPPIFWTWSTNIYEPLVDWLWTT